MPDLQKFTDVFEMIGKEINAGVFVEHPGLRSAHRYNRCTAPFDRTVGKRDVLNCP